MVEENSSRCSFMTDPEFNDPTNQDFYWCPPQAEEEMTPPTNQRTKQGKISFESVLS